MEVHAVWLVLAAVIAALFVVIGAVAWLMWRGGGSEERTLVKRLIGLRFRNKLRLALALARDSRIPLPLRTIPPGLILYLATPIDVVPDFIPVLGHLDDLVIVIVGVGLLLRFTPRYVLEDHIARLEAAGRER